MQSTIYLRAAEEKQNGFARRFGYRKYNVWYILYLCPRYNIHVHNLNMYIYPKCNRYVQKCVQPYRSPKKNRVF